MAERQAQCSALLSAARSRIHNGDGPGALGELLQAVQLIWGDRGSLAATEQFKQSFLAQAQAGDDLSALAAQLEAVSISSASSSSMNVDAPDPLQQREEQEQQQQPIIAAQLDSLNADAQQQLAAAQDSSYICPHCGGMVALSRRHQHETQWCPAISGAGELG